MSGIHFGGLFLGALFFLAVVHTWGAVYHVDSEDGNDALNGLTESSAWKTLDRVSNSTALNYGDSVLLKRGGVWNENLRVASLNGLAGEASRFRIGSYGAGEKPLLMGGKIIPPGSPWVPTGANNEYRLALCPNTECSSTLIMAARQDAGSVYQRLELGGGPGFLAPDEFAIDATVPTLRVLVYRPPLGRVPGELTLAATVRQGIVVEVPYVTVEDVRVLLGGYPAVEMGAFVARGSAAHVEFLRCESSLSVSQGFVLLNVSQGLVESCAARKGRGTGIYIMGDPAASAWNTVRGCESVENGALVSDGRWTGNVLDRGGIAVHGSSVSVIGNAVRANGNPLNLDHVDAEIHVTSGGGGFPCCAEITGNWVEDGPREGIRLDNTDHSRVVGNVVRRWGLGGEASTTRGSGILVMSSEGRTVRDILVAHNTVLDLESAPLYGVTFGMSLADDFLDATRAMNNLVFTPASGGQALRIPVPRFSGWVDYNLVLSPNPYFDLTAFGPAANLHALESDPQLSEPTHGDVSLRWNSPAIDAGVDMGRLQDYFGQPIYGDPDIGAVEYQPPYTMGIHRVDRAADIRIYADGKFRNRQAPVGQTAVLSVRPAAGFGTEDRRHWMDLSVEEWLLTGSMAKRWRMTAGPGLSGPVTQVAGDLKPETRYKVWVTLGAGPETAMGVAETNNMGKIQFDYSGGWAGGAMFRLEETTEPVTIDPPTDEGSKLTWGEVYAYPNPASRRVTFHVEVEGADSVGVDVYGESGGRESPLVLREVPGTTGFYRIFEGTWNVGNASSGVYFLTVSARGGNGAIAQRRVKCVVAK